MAKPSGCASSAARRGRWTCACASRMCALVGVLLALACEAKRLQPAPEFEGPPSGAIPLPLSAINVGQTDDGQTFLLLEVGAASLMFALPPGTLSEVGQTLLALSARATAKPS